MQSFTIDELLPKKNITELKKRISETIWSDSIGEDTWDYGVPLSWLRKMADFWVPVSGGISSSKPSSAIFNS